MRSPSVNSDIATSAERVPVDDELRRPVKRGVGWFWLALAAVLLLIVAAFTVRSVQRGNDLRLRGPAEAPPGVLPTQGADTSRK